MTRTVHAADRQPALAKQARADTRQSFRTLVSGSFVPLEINFPAQQRNFQAALTTVDADQIHFTEVHAEAHHVERTPQTIVSGGSGFYKVSLLLSGSSMLVQDGREVVMQPGDLTVYDTSRPYSLLFGAEFRNLIVMFPKNRLKLPASLADQLTAVSLMKEHPELATVVRSYLMQFPEKLSPLAEDARGKLARVGVDLFETLITTVLDARPQKRDPHQILLSTIIEYIDARLGAPGLNPGEIAAAHFISTRHLHGLFRESGMTVSAWIRHRRLERCREDLIDSAQMHHTVSVIARRWGFTDPAHFSRVFKGEFGMTPSEARHH